LFNTFFIKEIKHKQGRILLSSTHWKNLLIFHITNN